MNQPEPENQYNKHNQGIITVNITNNKEDQNEIIKVIYQPVYGIPENQNPSIIDPGVEMQLLSYTRYIHRINCYVFAYLFVFVGCIGVQFGLYGSKTAAFLWIARYQYDKVSYLLLIVTLILFYIVKYRPYSWLLLLQIIIIGISFFLEIAAVSIAITHPVLYNYQTAADNGQYNNRRLEELDYDTCNLYYNTLSYYDYRIYYGKECDTILGYSHTGSSSEYEYCQTMKGLFSEQEYQDYYSSYCDSVLGKTNPGLSDYYFCQAAYNSFSYSIFQQKYGIYCNSVLGLSSLDNQIYKERYHYQSGNLCLQDGFYDIYKQYCYPLQYGMMAYEVLSLVMYAFLFIIICKRVRNYLSVINGNQHLPLPIEQIQPLPEKVQM